MTYFMKYNITIGEYKVNTLKSVSVKRSVEQLSDTATITLPGTLVNQPMEVNDKIRIGDPVRIELGYEENMNEEFIGYVKRINTDDTEITIECEDELYLWDVEVKDSFYGGKNKPPVPLMTILQDLAQQVNSKYTIECDFDFSYSKFTISKATALDVLRKIQDETKANIYFEGTTLHIHPLYGNGSWSGKIVKSDLAKNVVAANLQYKKAGDQKLKVEISYKDQDGQTITRSYGEGSKVIKKTINTADGSSLQTIAENEYNLWCYDGYEGDLTGWLIPFCQPTDKVEIIDNSRQYKNGTYYAVATDVTFSESGGRKKVTIGRKS